MDVEKILEVPISQLLEENPQPPSPEPLYPLFSKQFLHRHGCDLFAASLNWFLLDVAFYTSNLFLSQIVDLPETPGKDETVYNAAFEIAKLQGIMAACSTIPGYWFSVFFIDKLGRVKIQIMGFFFMAVIYLAVGIPYSSYWGKHNHAKTGFMILYGLSFFFANFGANTTTFIIPAEMFPARLRSTCHGIAGAVGKLGAIVGAVGFLWVTEKHDRDGYPEVGRMKIAFLILGGVCIGGIITTYLWTRETAGISLEENENDSEEFLGKRFHFIGGFARRPFSP